jgi:hypothetical protein
VICIDKLLKLIRQKCREKQGDFEYIYTDISHREWKSKKKSIKIHMHSLGFHVQFISKHTAFTCSRFPCYEYIHIGGHVFRTIPDIILVCGKMPSVWRMLNLITRPRRKHLDNPHACGKVGNGDQKSIRACL